MRKAANLPIETRLADGLPRLPHGSDTVIYSGLSDLDHRAAKTEEQEFARASSTLKVVDAF